MTKLTTPLVRETAMTERGETLVIEVHAKYLVYRFKGKREKFPLGHLEALDLARKLAFRRNRP